MNAAAETGWPTRVEMITAELETQFKNFMYSSETKQFPSLEATSTCNCKPGKKYF